MRKIQFLTLALFFASSLSMAAQPSTATSPAKPSAMPSGSAVAVQSSTAPASVTLNMPAIIADSLPWFAVRETKNGNEPFTKARLQKIAAEKNRVALVYFATWCIPCREGVKRLAASQDELAKNKVQVVLVNVGENDQDMINKWVDKLNASNFITIVDPFKVMTERFGIAGSDGNIALPKTLVVDKTARPVKLIGQEGSDWPSILWTR